MIYLAEAMRLKEEQEFLREEAEVSAINEVLIYLGTKKLGIDVMIVKLFATAIVMVYNFITRKLILEKHN